MVTRIKVSAEVDDSAFRALAEEFGKFDKAVSAQAEAWLRLAASSKQHEESFLQAAVETQAVADAMKAVAERGEQFHRSSRATAGVWTLLARGTRDAAGHIKNATVSLLEWGKIWGLVTGVVGVGALGVAGLGIDTLARSVAGTRQSAMGLGTTYGGLQAVRTNYQRYGDPDALLGAISAAQTDPARRTPFQSLGMGQSDLQGDTADVAARTLDRFKSWVQNVPDDVLGSRLQISHLDELYPLEAARRIKKDDRAGEFGTNMQRDRSAMEVGPDAQRKWQDFSTQLTRAGLQIEKVFATGLVNLEPGLAGLSRAAADIAAKLLEKNGPVAHWLEDLNSALVWLAGKMDTPEFRQSADDWVKYVGQLAAAAEKLAERFDRFVGWFDPAGGDVSKQAGVTDPAATAAAVQHSDTLFNLMRATYRGRDGLSRGTRSLADQKLAGYNHMGGGVSTSTARDNPEVLAYLREAAAKRHIDPDVAVAVGNSEGLRGYDPSAAGPDPGGDKGTSFGPFQLHYKSDIPGLRNPGMGDDYTRATGHHASDRHYWKEQIDYALDGAAKGGWTPWHGAAKSGIGPRQGIGTYNPSRVTVSKNTGGNPVTTSAATAAPP